MTVQFIEAAGQRMAILPAADYDRLRDAAEDHAHIRAAREAASRRDGGGEFLPASMLDRLLRGGSGPRVWREHRSITAAKPASDAGVHPATISKLESGTRHGRPAVWKAPADAPNVTPADIAPAI